MLAYNGRSLKDFMYTGAELQQDIVKVLCRWCCYQFEFTCDIIKMFRQILIDTRDRHWFRIVYDFGTGLCLQHFDIVRSCMAPPVRPLSHCGFFNLSSKFTVFFAFYAKLLNYFQIHEEMNGLRPLDLQRLS